MIQSDISLKPGTVLSNRQLMDIFRCACEGGIRYSSRSGTIVLVVNKLKNPEASDWKNGVLRFAGRPSKDTPALKGSNKRLAEFLKSGQPVCLFVVEAQGQYTYQGQVEEAAEVEMAHSKAGAYPIFALKLKGNR